MVPLRSRIYVYVCACIRAATRNTIRSASQNPKLLIRRCFPLTGHSSSLSTSILLLPLAFPLPLKNVTGDSRAVRDSRGKAPSAHRRIRRGKAPRHNGSLTSPLSRLYSNVPPSPSRSFAFCQCRLAPVHKATTIRSLNSVRVSPGLFSFSSPRISKPCPSMRPTSVCTLFPESATAQKLTRPSVALEE